MQHDDAAPDQRAKEDTRDAFGALQSQFEQAVAKCLGMRLAEVRAQDHHSSSQHDVTRGQRVWQGEDLLLHSLAVVLDRVIHR